MLQQYAYSWELERKGKSAQFCLEEHRKHCRGGSMWAETRKKGRTSGDKTKTTVRIDIGEGVGGHNTGELAELFMAATQHVY